VVANKFNFSGVVLFFFLLVQTALTEPHGLFLLFLPQKHLVYLLLRLEKVVMLLQMQERLQQLLQQQPHKIRIF
jgi:hypothetical protein